jgi:aminoglycoside 6-adenylyltransferase
MFDQILQWGNQEKEVRVLLLVGSRVRGKDMDELSDFDISVFGEGFGFIQNDNWLYQIGSPIVCIHEKFQWDDIQIPTRLTIFNHCVKVDFAFHPLGLLQEMVDKQRLNETYDSGYEILLDKEGLAAHLPKPQFKSFVITRPDHEKFANAQHEFWFEAWHVAKYLCRQDPWVAKLREDSMKKWLLLILKWNAASDSKFSKSFQTYGKGIRQWANPKYFMRLPDCFSGWDLPDRRKAFHSTMDLFRDIGKETAKTLGYEWLNKMDVAIGAEINKLIPNQHEQSKT